MPSSVSLPRYGLLGRHAVEPGARGALRVHRAVALGERQALLSEPFRCCFRCCDAADELELQRWNGSEWLEASWFRRPPVPAVRTEFNFRAPSHLGAEFRNVGACPPSDSPRRMFEEAIVEQRARRDSEKCIVQLTGAVTLLAEPYCITHPRWEAVEGLISSYIFGPKM